ncbi:MAG: carbohydrate-binding family 9-like protein [Bacteroidia bacterium]|nr:carbohydrate-binding family 9-like protein [Bacteroidia bacterium]
MDSLLRKLALCIIFGGITSGIAWGQSAIRIVDLPFNPETYVCYRTSAPLVIDGKLSETSWMEAPWTDDFQDIEGPKMPAPFYRTRAKVLWDDQYLYLAAWLEEPDLWATLKERESVIYYDNDFEVFIDPDADTHLYYEFEVNALATEWDLMLIKPYRDGGPYLNGWSVNGMKVSVFADGTINQPADRDRGWSVEIAMPWEMLRETAPGRTLPKAGDHWRLDFSRVEWRLDVVDGKYQKRLNPSTGKPFPEYNWVWSAPGVINMHEPEKWGYLQFSDKTAGTGEDFFVWNPDEKIRWALREIYYLEKKYFETHKTYTDSLANLGVSEVWVEGKKLSLELETTSRQFLVSAWSADRKRKLFIREDSKTWVE